RGGRVDPDAAPGGPGRRCAAGDRHPRRDGRPALGHGRAAPRPGGRARGVVGDAGRGDGRLMAAPIGEPGARHWRGGMEEYRSYLDLVPDDLEPVTLREGGTPLVHSDWLSSLAEGAVWLKVEGDNPTGSFKDRGMTVATSVACHEGAQAVVCASTGNTS